MFENDKEAGVVSKKIMRVGWYKTRSSRWWGCGSLTVRTLALILSDTGASRWFYLGRGMT